MNIHHRLLIAKIVSEIRGDQTVYRFTISRVSSQDPEQSKPIELVMGECGTHRGACEEAERTMEIMLRPARNSVT